MITSLRAASRRTTDIKVRRLDNHHAPRKKREHDENQDRPEYRSKPVPFSLSANDLVQTAVKIMSEKNIGSVVIVDDDMQVKGIVTERDLMRRLL